jgi:hypothetical protein
MRIAGEILHIIVIHMPLPHMPQEANYKRVPPSKLMLTVTCVASEPVLYYCAGAIQSNPVTDAVNRSGGCGGYSQWPATDKG